MGPQQNANTVIGMPLSLGLSGVQQGLPPRAAVPAVPVTLECQVQVPKGLEPGETFVATTPDGQRIEVPVPADVEPGSTISFSYTPQAPATAPSVVGMPIGMPSELYRMAH